MLSNIGDMEAILKHFLENRKIQLSFDDSVSSKYLADGRHEVVVKGIKGRTIEDTFLSDKTFVYIKEKYDLLIPTSLEIQSIESDEKTIVAIDNKTYFTNVKRTVLRNFGYDLSFNSLLNIYLNNGNYTCKIEIKKDSSLSDVQLSCSFMKELISKKCFSFIW